MCSIGKIGEDTMDKKELKRKAKETGADFVGVASIERFKEVPAYKNPLSIFPETKSVIIVGKRIVRGLVKGVEEGKQFKSYSCYGYVWLEDNNLSFIVYDIRYQKRGVFSD